MKITITGSLGHISKPLVQTLVGCGHDVTVISSSKERRAEIEQLGAKAAIGSLEDIVFLQETFAGADAVYTMVPPNNYFDLTLDLLAYYRSLGSNYAEAVKSSGVKRVVNLSSIGAHMEKGNGILAGAHNVEQILNALPNEVSITHIRPTSFYYNLYGYLDMIKSQGAIAANYGADAVIPWVSPLDIAEVVSEELVAEYKGRKIRYVVSEELSGDETAKVLGTAIGKPELKWTLISDEHTLAGLIGIGMNPKIAAGLVEMYGGLYSGLLAEDYYRQRPLHFGKIKMADFAQEFAFVYSKE